MHVRTLCALGSLVILAGCDTLQPKGVQLRALDPEVCDQPVCTITVNIVDGKPRPGIEKVTIARAYRGPDGKGVYIMWKINPQQQGQYTFKDDDGVLFGGNTKNQFYNGGFPEGQWPPGEKGVRFGWKDRNDDTGEFKYTLTVYDRNALQRPLTYDPIIANDP